MNNSAAHTHNRIGPMAASWLASFLLHGGLAVAAALFVQRMQLAPQSEPFRWNVAMVATGSPASPASTASLTPEPRRPTQSTDQPRPAARSVQPRVSTPVIAPPPEPIAHVTPEPQPLPNEFHPRDSAPSVPADAPSHMSSQHLAALSAAAEPTSLPHDSSTSLLESQVPTDSPLSSPSSANASTVSTDQFKAKPDYGWLTDLMARWIEDLNKRYPAALRTEGIQGKVMLTAMLHDDGLLSDVRIIKSSGNTTLDEVALEDVRTGPPVRLSRPLERAQLPVKFSIIYDLKTAR